MFNTGTKVLVKGYDTKQGIVLSIKDNFAEINIDSKKLWIPFDDLTDISDEQINKILQGQYDDTLDFILAVDAHRLLNEYKFNPYVLASSTKITIFPHQIDEVTWGLENSRIMIADEVGLGKTIIAALIASELKARGLADKILYVVPKSLVLKWQDELSGRFDTETKILDSEYVRQDNDPFSKDHYDYIASMDFLKREENRQLIKEKIDLVIVDEAHKFKINTDRFDLGTLLSEKSDSMIFLTATPHDGRDEDFMARMSLLDPFVPDISSSTYLWKRHIKENVVNMKGEKVFPERYSNTVDIELTNQEREINASIDNYIRDRYEEVNTPKENNAVRFLSIILKKRAASSFEALRVSLERRMNKLGTNTDANSFQIIQKNLNISDDENDADYEDQIGDAESFTIGGDIDRERASLAAIITQIEELEGRDSKLELLIESIKKIKTTDPKAKILLFTEYRDTLEYLIRKLSENYHLGKIDGTMKINERKQELIEFSRDTGPEILLCTDAAGEGIDMQFCNVEFNYDIPWNPNKLEQRMGRIHRIGQTRKVYYYNFIIDKKNSIDGYILDKLFQKINRIKESMGNDSIFDILGRLISPDTIAKMYEELLNSPKADWEAKIAIELDKIEENKINILKKTKQLLEGHKLDHTVLENIRKIRRDAVDSGEIRRFLEVWAESNEGKFEEIDKKTQTAKIVPPQNLVARIGGVLQGTFNGKIAQSKGWDYLALGNKKIQKILSYASETKPVTILSHPTKSGLICVYKLSVIDGRGRERNSKIVAMFHNEDGKISEIEPRSLWSYDEGEAEINSQLIVNSKDRLDKELEQIRNNFHHTNVEKINEIKKKTKDAVEKHTISKIEACNAKIESYKIKENTSPHYSKLIKKENNNIQELSRKMLTQKETIEHDFKSNVVTELIAIAVVVPKADANERRRVELEAMKIVMEYEKKSAQTDEQRNKIRDVSERDTGFDIESYDKYIEVKSFKTTGIPKLTSHEWETANRIKQDYWLYVVEDVFNEQKSLDEKITPIQNPYAKLKNTITPVEETTVRYHIENWKTVKASLIAAESISLSDIEDLEISDDIIMPSVEASDVKTQIVVVELKESKTLLNEKHYGESIRSIGLAIERLVGKLSSDSDALSFNDKIKSLEKDTKYLKYLSDLHYIRRKRNEYSHDAPYEATSDDVENLLNIANKLFKELF
jgi:superfamily II DNA or RNA helicase